MTRLTSTGQPDTTYGTGGTVSFAPAITIDSLAVDSKSRLNLAGVRDEEIFLARLLGGTSTTPTTSTPLAAGNHPTRRLAARPQRTHETSEPVAAEQRARQTTGGSSYAP